MNRMVMFADATGLEIKLVYYPPYHSKYNLIEHCWGILENHWNGTLLNSVATVVEWARTMTWKGTRPIVRLIETTYDKGVRIAKDAFRSHRKPTPTPRQPPQVRCPHPTSTRLTDLGWHEAKIASQDELIIREFPYASV